MTQRNNGRSFNIIRGDTFTHEFYPYFHDITPAINIGEIIDVWFTVKSHKNCPDSDAVLQVSLIDGLVVVNGEPAGTPANGELSLLNGRCSVVIDETETALLETGLKWWDIQINLTDDVVISPYVNTLHIVKDVTRSTS